METKDRVFIVITLFVLIIGIVLSNAICLRADKCNIVLSENIERDEIYVIKGNKSYSYDVHSGNGVDIINFNDEKPTDLLDCKYLESGDVLFFANCVRICSTVELLPIMLDSTNLIISNTAPKRDNYYVSGVVKVDRYSYMVVGDVSINEIKYFVNVH